MALTARRVDRLERLAEEIRVRHGVEALAIPADLSEPGAAAALVDAIAARGRVVDALVNNAGYGLPGTYERTLWADQQAFLQVLLVSVCELSHLILPGMRDRGFGRIVNVASLAGLIPGMPSHTLYGPTKAFLVRFSQALHLENLDAGVHVSALCPGFTWSEFHDVNGTRAQTARVPSWMWQSAQAVAEAGFRAVEANRAVYTSGAANRLIAGICKVVPESVILGWVARSARRFRDL